MLNNPGVLAFSTPTYSITENGTPITQVTVTRTGGSDTEVSATITLNNGTATTDDYNNTPIKVTFAHGDSAPKIITIPIKEDSQFEAVETLNLSLINPTNGVTIDPQNTAIVKIIDNDNFVFTNTDIQPTKLEQLTLPIPTALKQYETLSSELDKAKVKLDTTEEQLTLANDDYSFAKETFAGSLSKQKSLTEILQNLGDKKTALTSSFTQSKTQNEQKQKDIQKNIDNASTRLKAETNAGLKDGIQKEINGYLIQIQEQQNLLSIATTKYDQELAVIDFQISESNQDLQALTSNIIPKQVEELEKKNQALVAVKTAWEANKQAVTVADKALGDFLTDYAFLKTQDYSSKFLQDTVNSLNQKISNLQTNLTSLKNSNGNGSNSEISALEKAILEKQKIVGEVQDYQKTVLAGEVEFKQELETRKATSADHLASVKVALGSNNIESYVTLSSQLANQLKGLTTVWVDDLQDNHNLTIKVWNGLQAESQAFDSLTSYIDENLATPYGDYYLNEIQLDEALQIQESTVRRRDALADSVNFVTDALFLAKKQLQEYQDLAKLSQHYSDLTSLEKQYTILINAKEKLANEKELLSSGNIDQYKQIGNEVINVANLLQNNFKDNPNYLQTSNSLDKAIKQYQDLANQIEYTPYIFNLSFNQYLNPINTLSINENPDNALIGDFNGDGKDDLYFTWRSSGRNRLYLSNGKGGFTQYLDSISTLAINESPDNTLVDDFNGDGKDDVYFIWRGSGKNRLYLSNGQGGFTQYLDPIATGAINGHDNSLVGDFNGDGKDDVYFFWRGMGVNRLYLSNGQGGFTQYLDPIATGAINGHDNSLVGDFNGDGKDDVYFFWRGMGVNRLYLSNGQGGFTQYLDPIATGAINGHDNSLVGDFNGDGKDDVYFFWRGMGVNRLYLSNGQGGFTQYLDPIVTGAINGHDNSLVGDFNGDGRDDVYFFWRGMGVNRLYLSNGQGGFTQYLDPIVTGAINGHDNSLVGDFNGDGRDDNFFHWKASGANGLYLSPLPIIHSEGIQLLINQSNLIVNNYFGYINPKLIDELDKKITNTIQDLTLQIDLTNDQQEQWLETNLQKYIQQKQSNILGSSPNQDQSISNIQSLRLETAYLTLQAEQNSTKLQSYLLDYFNPTGDGTFSEYINTASGGYFIADTTGKDLGEFADINGDGKQDYVVVWNSGGKRNLATYLAKADGTFSEYINTASGGYFIADTTGKDLGEFADINGDGKQDYVVVWNSGGKRNLATYLAKADGTFSEYINTASGGYFIADTTGKDLGEFADINGDGKQDYVVVWNSGGKRNLATYLAKADGTFSEYINTASGGYFIADTTGKDLGEFADINGDGKQDYVVVWNSGGKRNLATYLAKADGTFSEYINTASVGYFIADTTGKDLGEFADINGDGKQDYVVVWNSGGKRNLATYLAKADGTFSE
ncbi:FG-GAP-like repeat-containing protein [Microcystis aeruginosa]|uniref:Calx-beta domain-containing protein n=1 Tax=Microcystis aeruginosa FD4 TaxID=2686288 RepID=A0A857D761_MICAE|nr:FG-GAP-like repeat-containing protein [Microcystis aeruginosa]QGZ91471.1 hypothetical protein GQR42_20095 [Microcystis aeruginosa FD4]